jgi:hypothetical protein
MENQRPPRPYRLLPGFISSMQMKWQLLRDPITHDSGSTVVVAVEYGHLRQVKTRLRNGRTECHGLFLGEASITCASLGWPRLSGHGPPTCILVLDANTSTAWSMTGGTITANACAGYSNSTASSGISLSGQFSLLASFLCSVGGASGSGNPYPSRTPPCIPILSRCVPRLRAAAAPNKT